MVFPDPPGGGSRARHGPSSVISTMPRRISCRSPSDLCRRERGARAGGTGDTVVRGDSSRETGEGMTRGGSGVGTRGGSGVGTRGGTGGSGDLASCGGWRCRALSRSTSIESRKTTAANRRGRSCSNIANSVLAPGASQGSARRRQWPHAWWYRLAHSACGSNP